jgi:nicotinamide mononucleotide transporter
MSVLSVIALVFGALGVWLTIKQTILCWPVSLVAVIASIAEFYKERLYGDMALQVFYFFAGIYGWIYWKRHSQKAFIVKRTDKHAIPYLLIFTILQAIAYYYILVHFGGDKPLADGILTACSLTATFMMTKKWLENWSSWVVIDGAYVILYLVKEMWLFSILYLLFAAMAFYGWLQWRKQLSEKLAF